MQWTTERATMVDQVSEGPDFKLILDEIDLYGIKILELVYCQDALTLQEVLRRSHVPTSRKVAMKRLQLLRDWELLDYGGNPLCIYRKVGLEDSVKKLIVVFFGRWGLGHE